MTDLNRTTSSSASSDTGASETNSGGEAAVSPGELFKKLGPTGPLAVLALAMPPISGFALIYFMKTAADWLRSHQESGVALYAVAFAVLSGLALLPTYAQAALGGFAFGISWGLPAALVGFAGGAAIGYAIARRASGDRVQALLKEHPKWQAVRDALVADHTRSSFWKTTGMVALIRMPPNSPFALTNLVMASVKVPWSSFVVGTVVGMLPRTAAAVWIGATIGMSASGEFATPLWLKIAGIGLAVLVLAIVMDIADRTLQKLTVPGGPGPVIVTFGRKLGGLSLVGALVVGFLVYRESRKAQPTPEQTPVVAPTAAPGGGSK